MGFMLGNLSIKEMQDRAGIEFPPALVQYMEGKHQPKAEGIGPGEWHCFDAPFMLVCGDTETATEIYQHLEPLSKSFKQKMQISVSR